MAILSIQTLQPTGLSSIEPWFIYLITDDTLATVTTTGYLNNASSFGYSFSNHQSALIYTTDKGNILLNVVISGRNTSLVQQFVSVTGSNIIYATANVTHTQLASGGQVNIQVASSGTAQYRIIDAYTNPSNSQIFNGGDRDIMITDGISTYGLITANALGNGGTDIGSYAATYQNPQVVSSNPIIELPRLNAITASTQPGANIYARYTGSSPDYTSGHVEITLILTQIAS